MTLWHRRLVYFIFILFFAVSLPLLFLYAEGYKYNFKKGHWQKTGVIFIDTRPQKAVRFFLNGREIDGSSPLRIRNLLPGKYELKLVKDGYKEWIKEVEVKEGETTFIQYARLFKENPQPSEILGGKAQLEAFTHANGLWALAVRNDEGQETIKLFKSDSGRSQDLWTGSSKIEKLAFLQDGKKLLAENNERSWLLDTVDLSQIELKKISALKNGTNLKVNPYNAAYVYYTTPDGIYVYNLENRKRKRLLKIKQAGDYLVEGHYIYYLQAGGLKSVFLNRFDLDSQQTERGLLALPDEGAQYRLADINRRFIVIKDKAAHNLWVINKQNWQSQKLNGVNYYKWSPDNNQLLFGNKHELWELRYENNKFKYFLITRSSRLIKVALWQPQMTHIIYCAGDKIKVVENMEWNRQTDDLYTAKNIIELALDSTGKKLFFLIKQDDGYGLFELKIQ